MHLCLTSPIGYVAAPLHPGRFRYQYHQGYRTTSSTEKMLHWDDDRDFDAFHLHYDKGLLLRPTV
jgi:hypothetical protein